MIDTMNRQSAGAETQEVRDHSEGSMTRALENQAAKIPSDVWLFTAIGAIGVSMFLRLNERKEESVFVGQWVAPLLLIGVYNKLVKIGGSDRVHRS